jgi:LysM repeat protein
MSIPPPMRIPLPVINQVGLSGDQATAPSNNEPAPTSVTNNITAATGAGADKPGAPADTHVFNNLAGRDPDLIYAGETIKLEVNGKVIEHKVAAGETLSGIADKKGITVESIINANQMAGSLIGKQPGATEYFTAGGPQPGPGAVTTVPSNAGSIATSGKDAVAPSKGVPDTETAAKDKKDLDQMLAQINEYKNDGRLSVENASALTSVVTNAQKGNSDSKSQLDTAATVLKEAEKQPKKIA